MNKIMNKFKKEQNQAKNFINKMMKNLTNLIIMIYKLMRMRKRILKNYLMEMSSKKYKLKNKKNKSFLTV